jgi:opacity protein-like surface antigen
MKVTSAGLIIGLVSLAATLGTAEAADMDNRYGGGSRGHGAAAVPVPAPVPFEEHYTWYLGAGVGWTMFGKGSTSYPTGFNGSEIEDLNGPAMGSIFMGRYITPSLRIELGADFRAKQKLATGTNTYQTGRQYGVGANKSIVDGSGNTVYSGPSQNYNIYDVTQTNDVDAQTNTYMLNLYYEFNRGGRLKPYVGAGIGVAQHRLSMESIHNAVCDDAAGTGSRGGNNIDDLYGLPSPTTCWDQADLPRTYQGRSGASATGWGVAASLMAGVTYDLTQRTHLDVGYRMMWQGGKALINLPGSTGGWQTLSIGERLDHEVRTALRFDIW